MRLPIELDHRCGIPLYIQLTDQIHLLLRRGDLRAGDPMPTVRAMAVALGINANTVSKVYRNLQKEGLLRLERGVGTFVAEASLATALDHQIWISLSIHARLLISEARKADLSLMELVQLVETQWKEPPDAEG